MRGGNVFGGYLDDAEKTAESLDDDGWLHSGDIGAMDDDGYVRIVDRKKELIVTAGGKNISPANLEAAIKDIPLVGQAFAVGDGQRFVAALITLDPDYAPVWAAERGLPTDLATLAGAPEVRAAIEAGLAEVMEPFNHAEQVKKFTLLADDWQPDSDVLTPTSKLKRRGILAVLRGPDLRHVRLRARCPNRKPGPSGACESGSSPGSHATGSSSSNHSTSPRRSHSGSCSEPMMPRRDVPPVV